MIYGTESQCRSSRISILAIWWGEIRITVTQARIHSESFIGIILSASSFIEVRVGRKGLRRQPGQTWRYTRAVPLTEDLVSPPVAVYWDDDRSSQEERGIRSLWRRIRGMDGSFTPLGELVTTATENRNRSLRFRLVQAPWALTHFEFQAVIQDFIWLHRPASWALPPCAYTSSLLLHQPFKALMIDCCQWIMYL